jgi:hypothetical protein
MLGEPLAIHTGSDPKCHNCSKLIYSVATTVRFPPLWERGCAPVENRVISIDAGAQRQRAVGSSDWLGLSGKQFIDWLVVRVNLPFDNLSICDSGAPCSRNAPCLL